jgi:hypothetical protein
VQHLFDELMLRVNHYYEIFGDGEEFTYFPITTAWKSILSGNVLVANNKTMEEGCNCINQTSGVSVLTNSDVKSLDYMLDELSEESIKPSPDTCNICEDYSLNLKDNNDIIGDIFLRVELDQFTDDELVEKFRYLLQQSRNKQAAPEPKFNLKGIQTPFFKRIISFNIIPYLDLLLWCIYKNAEHDVGSIEESNDAVTTIITPLDANEIKLMYHSMFNDLLFDGVKSDDFMMKELPKKLKLYLNFEELRKAKHFLNKEKYLRNQEVSTL